MGLFALMVAVVVVLALVTMWTGRSLIDVLQIRWLQGCQLEAWIVSAFLGTGLWILGFGWCSYLGFNAREARWPLFVGAAFLPLAARWRGTSLFPLPKLGFAHRLVLIAILLAIALTLLPLLAGRCINPFNDTVCYVSLSRWLQDHPFSLQTAPDPEQPLTSLVYFYQFAHLRMGSTFLLALLQAWLPRLDPLYLYEAEMAWGMALNVGGIYLLARWAFHLPRLVSAAAALYAALSCNLLLVSIRHGFQPQTFGTAYLSLMLALLSRYRVGAYWNRGNAMVVGILVAAFLSIYSELFPLLALVGAGYLGLTLWRAYRRSQVKPFVLFTGQTLLAMGIAGNIEWIRAYHGVLFQLTACVGWHSPWTIPVYWSVALGVKAPLEEFDLHLGRLGVPAVIAATAAFGLGMLRSIRDRRTYIAGMALVLFVLLAVYFHGWAVDPFTHEIGHTWSLYKLCKWSFPLLLVVQFAGLDWIRKQVPKLGWTVLLPAVLGFIISLPREWNNARDDNATMMHYAQSPDPVKAWKRLNRRLDELGARNVFFIRSSQLSPHYNHFSAYFLYPRPMLNGWKDTWLEGSPATAPPLTYDAGTQVVMWGDPPFEAPLERLPGGLTRLDTARPYIVDVENPTWGVERYPDGEGRTWIGPKPAIFHVWSPRAGTVLLTANLTSGPANPETLVRHLSVRTADRPGSDMTFSGSGQVRIPIEIHAGASTIVIECSDTPTAADPEVHRFLTYLSQAKIQFVRSSEIAGLSSNAGLRPLH
jgi:hypothetical protein